MRKRELVARLKDDRRELVKAGPGFLAGAQAIRVSTERRLFLLHDLERLLPEIIDKLEGRP